MDIFYAMGMNLTKKVCVKYGQTDDVEKKFCKFDEVVSLVQQAVKEPEHTGNYHDYVELCKLYDKNENGTMMLAELETFLSLMGEFCFLEITILFTKSLSRYQRCIIFKIDVGKTWLENGCHLGSLQIACLKRLNSK